MCDGCVSRVVLMSVLMASGAGPASAQMVRTFSNPTPISVGPNNPQPTTPASIITSTGLTDIVVKIRVTLRQITHPSPTNMNVWLVAPNGQNVLLMGRVPSPLNQVTLEFDDCARRALVGFIHQVGPMRSGRYRPGIISLTGFGSFPSPPGPYPFIFPQLTLAGLTGTFALGGNGPWSLYVQNDSNLNTALIAGGWDLTIFTQPDTLIGPPGGLPVSLAPTSCAKPDYDGDGIADVAVYRPTTGEWFVFQSSSNTTLRTAWGMSSATGPPDIAVPADYDGDGQTDFAVYRESEGTWHVRYSSGGTAVISFGARSSMGLGDTPIPGDYDGDGIDDVAVYRTSTGQWFILRSIDGSLVRRPWGSPANGDYPARR